MLTMAGSIWLSLRTYTTLFGSVFMLTLLILIELFLGGCVAHSHDPVRERSLLLLCSEFPLLFLLLGFATHANSSVVFHAGQHRESFLSRQVQLTQPLRQVMTRIKVSVQGCKNTIDHRDSSRFMAPSRPAPCGGAFLLGA